MTAGCSRTVVRPGACAPSRTPTRSERARHRARGASSQRSRHRHGGPEAPGVGGRAGGRCQASTRAGRAGLRGRAADKPAPGDAPPAIADAARLGAPAAGEVEGVPWSGLVRTKGRPSVTLTPCSTPRYLTGIRPWSCVIAITMSNSPGAPAARGARMNTVSGAWGPLASMPQRRRLIHGWSDAMMRLRRRTAPSPACGFRLANDARRQTPARRRRVRDAHRLQHRIGSLPSMARRRA